MVLSMAAADRPQNVLPLPQRQRFQFQVQQQFVQQTALRYLLQARVLTPGILAIIQVLLL